MRKWLTTFLLAIVLILSSKTVFAQVPNDPNLVDAWYQGTMEDIRIFYGYRSEANHCHCRIDYYHDGRIRLLAVESFFHIPDSNYSSISTFYLLRPTPVRQQHGYELVRVSSVNRSGPYLTVDPVIEPEDLFRKHCVPHLKDLFKKIPAAEVKMWKDQYSLIF